MKHIITLHRQSVILAIAFLAGILLMNETYYNFYEYVLSKGIRAHNYSWGLLIGQGLYFVFLAWLLLQVNVRKRLHFTRQCMASLLIMVIFGTVAHFAVPPLQRQANDRIYNEMKTRGIESVQPEYDYWDYDNHRQYYHHEPNEAWCQKAFILSLVIFTLAQLYAAVVRKQELEKEYERLKNESLQSKLLALNNQINPHFFFNTLNSLYSLINEDRKERSLQYVENLSLVFRYILQSDKRETVTLQDELNFLDTYYDMLAVKYGGKLTFDINIPEEARQYRIPVLSILPLIENVIKHNEISSRNPMQIRLYMSQGSLVVENPKHEKLDAVERVGIGLKNLDNRFQLLFSKSIIVDNGEATFSVSLPLSANHQSSNRVKTS